MAAIARLTRGSVIETLSTPHVRTARSKGLSSRRILFRHVLPNALTPVLSFLGPAAAAVLTGSVVIEQVFDDTDIGLRDVHRRALPGLAEVFVVHEDRDMNKFQLGQNRKQSFAQVQDGNLTA